MLSSIYNRLDKIHIHLDILFTKTSNIRKKINILFTQVRDIHKRIDSLEKRLNRTVNKYYAHSKILCASKEINDGKVLIGYLFSSNSISPKEPIINVMECKQEIPIKELQIRCLEDTIECIKYSYLKGNLVIGHNFDFKIDEYIGSLSTYQYVIVDNQEINNDSELTYLYDKLLDHMK